MKDYIQNHKKTLFLKIALVLMFIPFVAISFITAPLLIIDGYGNEDINFWYVLPFSILMGLAIFPCGIAIFRTWKLLNNIEKGTFFSKSSVHSLNIIKYCGIVVTILFALMLPSLFYFMQIDDAPGMGMLGPVFMFASATIAVFASVISDVTLEKVAQE